MLAKILLFLTSLFIKYTALAGSASAENPQLIDFLATGLNICPMDNWNCEGDTILSIPNTESWEDCGRECEDYPGCEYWTYTDSYRGAPVCFLKSSCKGGKVSYGSTSGSKICPYAGSESRDGSCGSCPYCIGPCVYGSCQGSCIPTAKAGSSLEEACLYEATSLATNDCSGQCVEGGEPDCQDCISNAIPADCTKLAISNCFNCLIVSGKAVYTCWKKDGKNAAKFLTCLNDNIPAKCIKCACKIACKRHPFFCKHC